MRRSRVIAAIACCAFLTPLILAFRGEFASYTTGMILSIVFIGFCALASGALVWLMIRRRELQALEEKAKMLSELTGTDLASGEVLEQGDLGQAGAVPAGSGIPHDVLQRAAKNAPKVLFETRRRKTKAKAPTKSSETVS